jgi:hypothetical protein
MAARSTPTDGLLKRYTPALEPKPKSLLCEFRAGFFHGECARAKDQI